MKQRTGLSFGRVLRVMAVLLISVPFYQLAWTFTVGLYFLAGQTTLVAVFIMASGLAHTLGAWFGGNLAVTKRNLRLVALVGNLLMLPFTWSYWAFIHKPTDVVDATTGAPTWEWVTLAGLNDYYWQATACATVGGFGCGMLSTAALAYVGKMYQVSEKSYVGKVVGTYTFTCALCQGVMYVFGYTYLNSSNSPVLGGIMPLVAGIIWWNMCGIEKEGQKRFCEMHSFWDQTQRFLNMLAPLTASWTFATFGCVTMAGVSNIDLSQMTDTIGMASCVAAAVFYGWGFDSIRAKALTVWNFMAIISLLLALCQALGVLSNLVVWTTTLCNITGAGGLVYMLAHMLYESDHCVISTVSAYNVLSGLAALICTLFMIFFSSNLLLAWAFLLVTVGLALALNLNGLPVRREKVY